MENSPLKCRGNWIISGTNDYKFETKHHLSCITIYDILDFFKFGTVYEETYKICYFEDPNYFSLRGLPFLLLFPSILMFIRCRFGVKSSVLVCLSFLSGRIFHHNSFAHSFFISFSLYGIYPLSIPCF